MKALATLLIGILTNGICGATSLELRSTIPLPGVKGRFDHFAVDTKGHRVFVAALGNNTLEVISSTDAKRLHTITGLHSPTGVAYLPTSNQIVVAGGGDGTVRVYDGTSYAMVRKLDGLADADNVRLEDGGNQVLVGNGDGALAIIDAQAWRQIGSIGLKAHPESFQLEHNGGRIFVNLPDLKQVVVVDREKSSVIATWPLETFRGNFPMALDEAKHRLFVGCRNPAQLIAFDTSTGKIAANTAIAGDIDDLFFDARRGCLYLACGEGFIEAIRFEGSKFELLGKYPTRGGARTGFYSAASDEFYLAVPERGGRPAELRIYRIAD